MRQMIINLDMGMNKTVVVPLGTAMEIIKLQELHKEQQNKGFTCKAGKTFRKLCVLVGGIDGISTS